jgi:hypothetical protein
VMNLRAVGPGASCARWASMPTHSFIGRANSHIRTTRSKPVHELAPVTSPGLAKRAIDDAALLHPDVREQDAMIGW